jgi:ABC-2 type transport system permease protein
MRQIYAIAKAELSILFYSPIAWLIIVIFSFQAYSSFAGYFEELVTRQELVGSVFNITVDLFTNWRSVFPAIQENLYLFVPLLTMGLMSREYSSGSIKMLYSSPVSDTSIIFGKYLSIVIFTVIMMGTVLPLVGFTMFKVDSADLTFMLSGWLGLTLLMCAYAAIGMFMSTLTSYQVVAAMLTLGVLAFLNKIGTLAQDILILKDITYWLSLSGRVDTFIGGLVTSEDLLYFVIVIGLFFFLSVTKLQSVKNKYSIANQAVRYSSVVIFAVILGYISSRPRMILYYDASQVDRNTITRTSQEILDQIEGKLSVTTYVNMADNNAYLAVPRNINNDLKRFNNYIRFKPDISLDYVYYYDEPMLNRGYEAGVTPAEDFARTISKVYKLSFDKILRPHEMREKIDLSSEKYGFVRRAELENGKYTYIRVYDDPTKHPTETEMMGALRKLVKDAPQISFLTGNGEPDIYKTGDSDYLDFATRLNRRASLVNQGYEIGNVVLNEGSGSGVRAGNAAGNAAGDAAGNSAGNEAGDAAVDVTVDAGPDSSSGSYKADVLADTDILVVADPKVQLDDAESSRIIDYIREGRNLLIAFEPGRTGNMEDIAKELDLKFMPGTLVHPYQEFNPTLIPSRLAFFSTELSYYFSGMGPSVAITMPGAVGLDFELENKFEVIPVATTAPFGYWNETETKDFSFGRLSVNRAAGEIERVIPTALALTRVVNGKEQRIMVLGDADCLSNSELNSKRSGLDADNTAFARATFHWLSHGELPVDVRRQGVPDNTIFMNMRQLRIWKVVLVWTVPILLAALGLFICVRRKRR